MIKSKRNVRDLDPDPFFPVRIQDPDPDQTVIDPEY